MAERYPKRLIEVDLPIKRISAQARREKSIRHGHISTLHIWWARRPLAACRAVICAALWPDPADPLCPQSFREQAVEIVHQFAIEAMQKEPTKKLLEEQVQRWHKIAEEQPLDPAVPRHLELLRFLLLDFIAAFSNWDASTEECFLKASRALTQAAHEALGGAPGTRPLVVDPFAGGGSIPLEALRVGADAFASDLNPVAVLLNKVVLEYIPKYGQRLADEVRKWGEWIKKEAEKELAEFYPKDPDGATPIAYLWARTIKCEGPGCGAEVPLIRSLWLAKKANRSVALQLVPRPKAKRVDFRIIVKQRDGWVDQDNPECRIEDPSMDGTVKRGSATCPCCGYTTPLSHVKDQLKTRHGGAHDARLFCIVTTSDDGRGRRFRLPTGRDVHAINRSLSELHKRKKAQGKPFSLVPNETTAHYHTFVNRGPIYGMTIWENYFTPRQALALGVFSILVQNVATNFLTTASEPELADAVQTCLALALDKQSDSNSSLCSWRATSQDIGHTFGRQALPMLWDFVEANVFSGATRDWTNAVEGGLKALQSLDKGIQRGHVEQASASAHPLPDDAAHAVITDPPYYYSVQYADLSDFFYVWLRRCLITIHPSLFQAELTPKDDEIIVQSPGHQFAETGKNNVFYESRMKAAMMEGRRVLRPSGIGLVVFAHTSTAGWEAQLQAMLQAGWIITASWPIDTEMASRVIAQGRSVLASSVHLVSRPRENPDGSLIADRVGDWRDVLAELPGRIHAWMPRLAQEGIVGADAIFACLGPALEIFSRYSRVEKASGEQVTLKEYLEHVWVAVAKEALNMIFEGADATGFEEDARLTAMWLWTLSTADNGKQQEADEERAKLARAGYTLEFDAARKIAQGLGAHLEQLKSLVEIKGDKARLLPVSERTKYLFGKGETDAPRGRKKKDKAQLSLFAEVEEAEAEEGGWGEKNVPAPGTTTLDRVHQSMILFAAGRGEALKRFLVEEGAGRDERFWRLAQSLSALYPSGSDEKRWVDGVLARKKGLGF